MYTTHGHHIPFTFLDEERPEHQANCGGPRMCPPCTLEAMPYAPMYDGLKRSIIIEKAQQAERDEVADKEFQLKARQIVVDFFNENAEKTDNFELLIADTYVVWFSKVLGNWKALISTTVPDGMYYEVTYSGDKAVTYLDAYKKFKNVAVPDGASEYVLTN